MRMKGGVTRTYNDIYLSPRFRLDHYIQWTNNCVPVADARGSPEAPYYNIPFFHFSFVPRTLCRRVSTLLCYSFITNSTRLR